MSEAFIVNKISNCKKILLFIVTIGCSIPHVAANTNAQIPEEIAQELTMRETREENLENLLKTVLKQLNDIDVSLEELALIINNGTTKSNKAEISAFIKEIREFIKQISTDTFTNVSEANLAVLAHFTHYLIGYLRTALSKDLARFEPFTFEQSIRRMRPDFSASTIQHQLDQNERDLACFVHESKNVGLRWYNKAYRALDNTIIQPCQKYNVGKYMLWGGLGATAATLFAWQYARKFEDVLGEAPQYDRFTGTLLNEYRLGTLGKMNNFLIEHTKGYLPINSFIYSTFIAASLPQLIALKNYSYKKGCNLINFLKGGSYTTRRMAEDDDLHKITPRGTLKDLIGLEYVKDVFSHIVKYIEDPERFDRSKLTPEKGFLLTGPTRTGKTFSAEALAGEIQEMYKRTGRDMNDFNFYSLNAPLVKTLGVRKIFEILKKKAPCIIFFDELDLLGLNRVGDKELLSEFLTVMSGCLEHNDPKKPIILIAATNQPETLDTALRQPGRFGTEIRYEYPCLKYRKDYLTQKLTALAVNLEDFDVDQLARETEGCSFEDLNAVLRKAHEMAKKAGEPISPAHIEQGLDLAIRHIVQVGKELPADEKQLFAIHQAGHAVAALLLESKQQISKVTIKPYQPKLFEESQWDLLGVPEEYKQKKIGYGRIFTYNAHDTANYDSGDEKLKRCKIFLAGHIAEELLLGSCGYSYHTDDGQRALTIAASIASKGIALQTLPDDLKTKFMEKALVLKKQCEDEVTALLKKHKDALHKIAQALQERESLTRSEIEAILFPEKAVPAVKKHLTNVPSLVEKPA